MNTSAHVDPQKSGHEVWEEFSHSFTPAVREVVEFAKKIPGFRDLSQPDQVSLLKAGTFEVCWVLLCHVPWILSCRCNAVAGVRPVVPGLTVVFVFCRCWWFALPLSSM